MMASPETDQGQHFVECDLCQKPVSFFCRRCGSNLCDACVPVHLRLKSKTGHEVVDYGSRSDDHTNFCDSHPKNKCSAYCKTCDAPICMLCISLTHKSHELSDLSDRIEQLLNVITRENDRLQSNKRVIEAVLYQTSEHLSSLPSFYNQRKERVTTLGEEWHKQIEKTVITLRQKLDEMQKEHEAILQKQKKELEDMVRKVDEINRKATTLRYSKNVMEMQTLVAEIENPEILSEFSNYTLPTFRECKIDANYMQTYFEHVDKMQGQMISFLEKKFKEKCFSGRKILNSPKIISALDTGFPADKVCKNRLYDMAVTDDNKVWMGGHSKELKLFDLQGNLHHTVSITCKGLYLCMYNKQVVYSDIKSKAVKRLSLTGTEATMFTTGDWFPRGITSTSSGNLLVCLDKDGVSKVVRYSSTGTVLQEIQYDSHCQPLYKEATYITENINGDIIVTDWKKNAVIVVDELGIFRYSYVGRDNYFVVSSVATDSDGQVIVTDYGGNRIHMLDIGGQFLRYVIPEGGVKRPRAICILGNGEMLVGGNLDGVAKRIRYLKE